MWRSPLLRIMVLALFVAAPIALAAVWAQDESANWPSGQLTVREESLARALAERELFQPHRGLATGERIYFTKIELLPDSQAETELREVVVTHYRYRGNEAIRSFVDLNAKRVFKVETVVNMPTPLADEERRLAVELARANPQLVDVFAEYGDELIVEAKPGWPADIEDPAQPHRNVHLLFRVGRDYLSDYRVVVDLVNEAVHVSMVEPNS